MPRTRKTRRKQEEKSILKNTLLASTNKSYRSLMYGVITVIVLFALIAVGFKFFTPRRSGEITKEAAKTSVTPEQSQTPTETPKKTVTEPTQTPSRTSERTYIVQAGDSLWTIAEKEYKSGYNWRDIASANKIENPGLIFKGTKLIIPSVRSIVVVSPTPAPQAASKQVPFQTGGTKGGISAPLSTAPIPQDKITEDTYTVQHGEYLWEIAVRAYGDGFRWVDIARANNLTSPNIIHSGNVLKVPR